MSVRLLQEKSSAVTNVHASPTSEATIAIVITTDRAAAANSAHRTADSLRLRRLLTCRSAVESTISAIAVAPLRDEAQPVDADLQLDVLHARRLAGLGLGGLDGPRGVG